MKQKNAPGTLNYCPNASSEVPSITSRGLPQLDADQVNATLTSNPSQTFIQNSCN